MFVGAQRFSNDVLSVKTRVSSLPRIFVNIPLALVTIRVIWGVLNTVVVAYSYISTLLTPGSPSVMQVSQLSPR